MLRPKRMIPLALACALLATLSGCGGGDETADGGGAAPDTAAAARTAAAGGGGSCTPPPPVPFDTVSGQPWAPVAQYLSGRGFTQPGKKTKVRLCKGPGCVLKASIVSDTTTYCLPSPGTDNQLRMLGMVIAEKDTDAPRLGFTPENAGDTVYLLSKGGQGYSLYRNATNNTTQWVPNTVGSGWQFNFCNDGVSHPSAAARWKKYDGGGSVAAVGDSLGEEEDPTEIATGWMACVNGCCRFYGSPPPGGVGADPDTLKGGQQGQGQGNAPVCPDTLP